MVLPSIVKNQKSNSCHCWMGGLSFQEFRTLCLKPYMRLGLPSSSKQAYNNKNMYFLDPYISRLLHYVRFCFNKAYFVKNAKKTKILIFLYSYYIVKCWSKLLFYRNVVPCLKITKYQKFLWTFIFPIHLKWSFALSNKSKINFCS